LLPEETALSILMLAFLLKKTFFENELMETDCQIISFLKMSNVKRFGQ
jgi:hypothetical protein